MSDLYNQPFAQNTRKVIPGEFIGRKFRYILIESDGYFQDDPYASNSEWARAVRVIQNLSEVQAAYLPNDLQQYTDYYDSGTGFVAIVVDDTAEYGQTYGASDNMPGNFDFLVLSYALQNEFQDNGIVVWPMYFDGSTLVYVDYMGPPELQQARDALKARIANKTGKPNLPKGWKPGQPV